MCTAPTTTSGSATTYKLLAPTMRQGLGLGLGDDGDDRSGAQINFVAQSHTDINK